nr:MULTISPECIES: DUF2806 domain-containing protein [unclassified Halorhodospira]
MYEPRRIKKRAEAEAEADKIKYLASKELDDLEQRAVDRLVHQEGRKQRNIEEITAQAAESLDEDADTEELNEDWLAHFFKQCDTVSDVEMQSLWARLLSGEASSPGSYSKRTVDLVASLDKPDAHLFTRFCQFCWMIGDLTPVIFDVHHQVFKDQGIHFDSLKHLDSLGLISFESISGYKRQGISKYGTVFYFGTPVNIEFPKDENNELQIGKALLTQAGKELAPICGASKNKSFYDYVVAEWHKNGLVVSTPLST